MIGYLAILALAAGVPTDNQEARDNCASVMVEQADRLRTQSRMLLADAQYAEEHNNEFSPEMTQRYVLWYSEQKSKGKDYPNLYQTNLNPGEIAQRNASLKDFLAHEEKSREDFNADVRKTLTQACPWKASEIASGRWPEGF